MKRFLLPVVAFSCAVSCFAGTEYTNFTGYSDYWHPLGNPNTATYGETFTAPSNGDATLESFGFYMGNSNAAGDIKLSGYIATWTGSQAGTILYTSPMVDYANTGDDFLSFNTGGLDLTAGNNYVMFLSVSQYYNQSGGEVAISQGNGSIPGGAFVYSNNGGNFGALTSSGWSGPLSPNWAVDLQFDGGAAPEPATFLLFGGGLACLGVFRRRLRS